VKTRLATTLGAEQAGQLHKVFVQTLLERLARTGDRRTIVYAPADQLAPFAALAGGAWNLAAQAEGDLGQRMRSWFESAFAAGARSAVLIGSDSPTLPSAFIESAFELLREYDVVLGPADDGGYYLVGAARPTPPVFEDMAWSKPTVWDETVARLQAADWRYAALPRWYDVDQWEDLLRLHAELAAADASDSALARLKRAVAQAVDARRSAEPPQ
jgi:rSAM/selenodomain-associated transferase 1